MVYCNQSSLVILVNNAKYIHFYPTFRLPPTLRFTLQVQTIHKLNLILFISLILSKYIEFEVFENCLKWVDYINTLFSPCIAWIGIMESCLNFCVSRFTRNAINFEGVLSKRCAENMSQIYRRTPMPKCNFDKVAKHVASHGCSPVNLLHIFSEPLSLRAPPKG